MIPDHVTGFQKYTQPALLAYQEEKLVNAIEQMLDNYEHVTSCKIAVMAIELFYEPIHLAQKAIINKCINEGRNFIAGDNFIDEVNNPSQDLIEAAKTNPHEIINNYAIPNFSASRSWEAIFMKRHDYVYRKVHVKKRGSISQAFIQPYLQQLSQAVRTYGRSHVLNMDETQIKLNNFPLETIARQGQQDVEIHQKFVNTKIGTTYIGTIAMDPSKRFPLYCIAKGETDFVDQKYNNVSENECVMDYSSNGWCTADVMIRYINWLINQMHNEPFALALDIYSAHITHDVKKHAADNNVELIYVPANGTGTYQPLDRTIFGIVKKKLISKEMHDPIQYDNLRQKDIYGIIHHRLLTI